jgi:hypothetical protein
MTLLLKHVPTALLGPHRKALLHTSWRWVQVGRRALGQVLGAGVPRWGCLGLCLDGPMLPARSFGCRPAARSNLHPRAPLLDEPRILQHCRCAAGCCCSYLPPLLLLAAAGCCCWRGV